MVELECISTQTLEEQLAKHKQSTSELGEKIDISLKGSGLDQQTRLVCDVFSRFYPRMMKIATSITDIKAGAPTEKAEHLFWAQEVQGDKNYQLVLGMNPDHACYIASQFLKFDITELNELSIDAVSEFMNTFIGHIYSKLGESTQPVVQPPKQFGGKFDFSLEPCTTLYFDSGQYQISVTPGVKK